MLHGTFLKERVLSTLVLLVVVWVLIDGFFNPFLQSVAPQIRNDSLPYMAMLLIFLFAMMRVRDVVMMNILRPKIAAKRAEQSAKA